MVYQFYASNRRINSLMRYERAYLLITFYTAFDTYYVGKSDNLMSHYRFLIDILITIASTLLRETTAYQVKSIFCSNQKQKMPLFAAL